MLKIDLPPICVIDLRNGQRYIRIGCSNVMIGSIKQDEDNIEYESWCDLNDYDVNLNYVGEYEKLEYRDDYCEEYDIVRVYKYNNLNRFDLYTDFLCNNYDDEQDLELVFERKEILMNDLAVDTPTTLQATFDEVFERISNLEKEIEKLKQ